MRLVVETDPGVLELNYTWLPVWLGLSTPFQRELEKELKEAFLGKPLNDDTLEAAHRLVLNRICAKFPGLTLFEYLDGIKYVSVKT